MIAGTGFEKTPNEPTCFPRGTGVVASMASTDMYIYIGHESSVGVRFSNIPAYFASAMLSFFTDPREIAGSVTF